MKHHIAITMKNGHTYIMCAHKIHKGKSTGLVTLAQFALLRDEEKCACCKKIADKAKGTQ